MTRWVLRLGCLGLALAMMCNCSPKPAGSITDARIVVSTARAELLGAYLSGQFPGGKAVIFLAPHWEAVGVDTTRETAVTALLRAMEETMSVQVVTLPLPEPVRERMARGTEARGDETLLLQISMDRAYFQRVASEWASKADVAVLAMELPMDVNGFDSLPTRANGLYWALLEAPMQPLPALFGREVLVAAVTYADSEGMRELAKEKKSALTNMVRERLTLVTGDNYHKLSGR